MDESNSHFLMRENILVQYARAIVNDHGPVPSHVGKGAVWPLNNLQRGVDISSTYL